MLKKFFKKKKVFDPIDHYLEQADNVIYAGSTIDTNTIMRHPEYVTLSLHRRILKSQTPKWVNYAILILTAIILGLTIYPIFK